MRTIWKLTFICRFSFLLFVSLWPVLAAQDSLTYRTENDILYYDRDSVEWSDYLEERCRLDLYFPENQPGFATVVWFHGGGLTGGNRFIPEQLKEKGFAVAAVNYRLHPDVNCPVYIQDAAAAVSWVFKNIETYGGDPGLIFVSGHSAGGYLTSMVGLDKRWLGAYGIDADHIAGLIPYSGHTITHMTVRKERGIPDKQPVVDEFAPLFHVRADAPPLLLITGDRELELLGRYEENAYMARMMKIAGHEQTTLHELQGYGHGMAEPAHPLLIQFVQEISEKKRETRERTWKDVDYVGDGITGHLLDIFLPGTGNGPFPVVLYIYGSAWFSNDRKGSVEIFKKPLLDAGFAVAAINHRSSREAIFPAQIHDAKAAVRFIRANAGAFHLDPNRIGVTGASSGGHLSSFLGTSGGLKKHSIGEITIDLEGSLGGHLDSSSSVMAVVDWFGPTDFLSMNSCGSEMDHDSPDSPESSLIGAPIQENPDKCALANPVTYIDREDPPFLIFHGNKDPLVPFCQSELLHKRLTEAGVPSTFMQVSDAGHGPGLMEKEYIQNMVHFFLKHLR